MKRSASFLLCVVIAILLAFSSPLTVFAQDSGGEETPTPETTPTEEPADTTPLIITTEGDVIEPETGELPGSTNVAYYCVVDNTTGTADCSSLYTSLSTTITDALGSTLGPGISLVINLLAGVAIYEDVEIDGSERTMDSISIVGQGTDTSGSRTILQGNVDLYDFTTGSINITGNSGGFEIFGQLTIEDSEANVNLSGLTVRNTEDEEDGNGIEIGLIDGDVSITNTDSTDNHNDGINIYSTGAVTLDNVLVAGNYSDGLDIGYSGDISINNLYSIFNEYNGVEISDVHGNLTITNSMFAMNGFEDGEDGLYVEDVYGDTTLIDVIADRNSNNGISLETGGNIYLDGVQANNNSTGAMLGYFEPDYSDSTANTITVRNSTFSDNGYAGLMALGYSGYLEESGGVYDGAFLADASEGYGYFTGSIYLENVTANNNFSHHVPGFSPYMASIYVNTQNADDGVITLNNVTTNNNGYVGISALGQTIVGSFLQSNGNMFFYEGEYRLSNIFAEQVTLGYGESNNTVRIECSQFNDNYGVGVYIEAYEIDLYGVESQGNMTYDLALIPEIVNDQSTDFSRCTEAAEEISEFTDIVIEVLTGDVTGTGSITNTQGLIFKLMEEMTDGQKDLLARVAIPASAAAAGTTFTFTEVSEGDPAALSAGMSYVGRSFTITAVAPDGSELNNVNTYIELLFKVDPNFTAPEGTHLAIVHYNEESGEWDVLSTGLSNGYAYAYSALTGAYALVTVSD